MRTILGRIALFMLWSLAFGEFVHAQEWQTYRHDSARTGEQPVASALSDPTQLANLTIKWQFPPVGAAGAFLASPIVVNDTVFIGSQDGIFYALDAASGALKWRYPKPTDPHPQLRGTCNQGGNGTFGQYGIRSSATYANIGGKDAVIFGAPDPDPGVDGGRGSAALFAVDFSGNLFWKSQPVAHVSGCTPGSLSEKHERIAFSSPLVLGNKVYVGVHDAGDDPIQQGRVSVVDISTGKLVPFPYASTGALDDGTRGGGVWNSLATDGTGVFFTTGNTRIPPCFYPYNCTPVTEPSPNRGLSMVRVDKDTGNLAWPQPFQPVPFNRDGDPDWSAGVTIMSASCGELIASVQKDGWSYAVNPSDGSPRWQFPPTGLGTPAFLNAVHGDDDYKRPAATWNDVLIIHTGGEALVNLGVSAGFGKLHALNACASTETDRVRWIADIPDNGGSGYSIGAPTVTGGVTFVGTDKGHLIVLADKTVARPSGFRCSNTDPLYINPVDCLFHGYSLVAVPQVLRNIAMPDGGDIAWLRKEPALAKDRVFVATGSPFVGNGHVYMLDTVVRPPPPDPCKQCRTREQCCICAGGVWDGRFCE